MIDIKELRIGNWLMHESGKCWCIKNVNSRLLVEDKNGEALCSTHKVFSPIPLSPELLGKCGWDIERRMDKSSNYDAIASHGWIYVKFLNGKCSVVLRGGGESTVMDHIVYLHQLQNFWYAHCGKEMGVALFDQASDV